MKKILQRATVSFLLALGLTSGLSALAGSVPWKFGVMSDTQWTPYAADAANSNAVAVSIINQINPKFISAGVKFVVQVGDLTENGAAADVDVRAAAAQSLYDAGIGFFPLRGNHEAGQTGGIQVTNDFPQTQGQGPNVQDATNFSSASSALAGLSYAFDSGNARFILLDQFTRLDGTYNTSTLQNNAIVDQVPWVTNTLSNRTAGTHAFVFSHKNLIGENHMDVLFGANIASNAAAQNEFIGALAGNGVRYTMSGHDHVFQRSMISSPDALSSVEGIICGSDSSKFYTPQATNLAGWAGQKYRETSLAQDLYRITYFIYTVDGPRVTADYYTSDATFPSGNSPSNTPVLNFNKRETFGYSLNGKRFLVGQGGSYTTVVDSIASGDAFGETYKGTTASILTGVNGSTNKDYTGRALVREINTGWAPSTKASDVLTLWGMADLATNRTDTYALSISYDPSAVTAGQAASGAFCLASKDSFGHWVNAVDLNVGGIRKFVVGAYSPSYALGTYGVDTNAATVWAVVNHASDFVAATVGDIVNFVYTSDNHYGIVRPIFRGAFNVAGQTVNEAMIEKINALPGLTFPSDGGVGAGQAVGHIDLLVDTGDFANRSEPQAAVTANPSLNYLGSTVSYPGMSVYTVDVSSVTWSQYQHDFLGDANTGNRAGGLLTLKDSQGLGIPVFLSPGNHDVSDAIGMNGKIPAANVDASSYVQIYNRMAAYSGKAPINTNVFANPADYTNVNLRVNYSFDVGGVHVQVVNMFPDRNILDWMTADLGSVAASTPVFVFCHAPVNMAAGETKVFGNPTNTSSSAGADIPFALTGTDSATTYKDMNSAKQCVADWLMQHPNVRAMFNGHDNFNGSTNWNGQDANGNLIAARDAAWQGVTLFRVDSPMKGNISGSSATGPLAGIGMETNLSFQVYSYDTAARKLTEREYLWNSSADTNGGAWSVQATTISLNFPAGAPALGGTPNGTVLTNGNPVLTWSPVDGATGYTVALTLPGGSNVYFNVADTNLTLPSQLLNGAYTWTVTSYNSDGNGPASTAGNFSIQRFTPKWSFGVMSDTQWTPYAADAANSNAVAVSIINQINPQFINAGVKFVVQVGDLTENGNPADVDVRAAAAQSLYDAGIGFFPLRGNHESGQLGGIQVTNDFPQTQGQGSNVHDAINFRNASSALAGLSYAFDNFNARFVLLDQFTRLDGSYSTSTLQNNAMVDQVPWIGNTLSNREANTHAFVFSHKNLIGENHTDALFGANIASNAAAQNQFIGALAGTGVRYTLSGHDHVFQRSMIASPDTLSSVEEIICGSDSSKFYTPGATNLSAWAGQKYRETPLVQDLYRITYYLATVDGPRFTMDYYASDETFPSGNSPSNTPTLHFNKRETFGYSLNGKKFLVGQGNSYTAVVDSVAAGMAYGETYKGTTARILSGVNGSTNKDYTGLALVREINTGWAPTALASDALTLWGMADVATTRTDTYVISMTYDPTSTTLSAIRSGLFGLVTRATPSDSWVNAADLNVGGVQSFVLGAWNSGYTLGACGVDTNTATAWAVVNHASDFAVGPLAHVNAQVVKVDVNVYQPFNISLTNGTWVYLEADPANASPLRATQRSLGYREVDYKATMFSFLRFTQVAPSNTGAGVMYDYTAQKTKGTYTVGYWKDKDLPVMVGPDGNAYITDGHHTSAGYLSPVNTQSGDVVPGLHRVVLGHVVTNFYNAAVGPVAVDDTWWTNRMAENNAMLYGFNGNQLALSGDAGYAGLQPILPSTLAMPVTPSTLGAQAMTHDHFRGLAWGLADGIVKTATNGATKIKGYSKTNPDTGLDINFVEFFWSDYLRNRIVWDDTKSGHALGSGFGDANAISAPVSFFAAVANGIALARSQDYRDQYGRGIVDYTNNALFSANTVRWASKSIANLSYPAVAGDVYNLFLLDDSGIAGDIAPSPVAVNILHIDTSAGMVVSNRLVNIRDVAINAGGAITTTWKDAVVTNTTLTIPAGTSRVTLKGSNTVSGAVTLANGTLVVDGSLTAASLTVAPGATLEFTPGSAPITVTGNLALNGTLNITGSGFGVGTYTLFNCGSLSGSGLVIGSVSDSSLHYSIATNVAGKVQLHVSSSALRIASLSDMHYFATNLLINNGVAFQTYLAQDRKLLAESAAITKSAVDAVIAQNPDIVLVSGDLTKDGELDSHIGFSNQLARLVVNGAKVLVIPGNHDINNTNAAAYDGASTIPVSNVTPDEFRSIYEPFGYGQAIARDTNSLSYIVEPASNLWVVCMDSCQYTNGLNPTAGSFDTGRLAWITNQLAIAKAQGKVVIGMMHHGLMEHFTGQKTLFSDYVLDGYTNVAPLFASYGVKAVFTGHYHAQDIVKGTFGGNDIYDIETGSTVTYPCPFRIMDLQTDGQLVINSYRITAIDYNLGGAPDFQTYAYNYLHSGMLQLSSWMLQAPPYGLSAPVANYLAPAVTEAMEDHYMGDEPGLGGASPATYGIVTNLLAGDAQSRMLGGAIWSMLTDLPPADNSLTMNLSGVTLVSPADGALYTEGQTIVLEAAANWDVTNVDFIVNGIRVGNVTSRPYTISAIAPTGTFSIAAVAWDNLGQTSTSSTVNVTVRPRGPTVGIKVNGSHNPVTVSTSQTVSVTIQLNVGLLGGLTTDWFILAHDVTRDTWYQYVNPYSTTSWRAPWLGGTSLQAPLVNVPNYEVLHLNGMAAGQYDFYFGIDMNRNGRMDFDTLYYDGASVIVTP